MKTWPRDLLVGLVQAYRLLLKPWWGNACRFEPSCSAYALQALQTQGALRGSALGAWRLLRCHPWCAGGLDPVPPHFSLGRAGLFTRLVDPTEPVACLQAPTILDQTRPGASPQPAQPPQPQTSSASPRTLS